MCICMCVPYGQVMVTPNSRRNPQIVGCYHTPRNETLRLLHASPFLFVNSMFFAVIFVFVGAVK